MNNDGKKIYKNEKKIYKDGIPDTLEELMKLP